ncbi:MAG: hypothetical protein AB1403_17440 [Candidatus Riflebacteria bacterium]
MLTDKWETIPEIYHRTGRPLDEIIGFLKTGHTQNKTVECRFDSQDGVTVCEWRNKQ